MTSALLIEENSFRPNEKVEELIVIHKMKPRKNSLWPWIGYTQPIINHLPNNGHILTNIFGSASIGSIQPSNSFPNVFGNANANQQFMAGVLANPYIGLTK